MGEISSNHTIRKWLIKATIMRSHATRKKEDCPLERKCRTENIIYKYKLSTSGHPHKVYLQTAEFDF